MQIPEWSPNPSQICQSLTYLWPIQPQSTKYCPLTSSTYASRTVSAEDTQIVHFGTNWLWIVTGHANTRSIQCTIPHLVKGTSTIETDYSQLGMNTSTSSNNQSMQFQNVNPWSNLYQSTNPMPIQSKSLANQHSINPPIHRQSWYTLPIQYQSLSTPFNHRNLLFFRLQNTFLTNSEIIFSDWHWLRQLCVNSGQSNANPSYKPPLS